MCFFYFTFYCKCVIINIGDNVKEYVLLIPSNIKNKIIKKVREKYYNYNNSLFENFIHEKPQESSDLVL